MQGEEQPRRAGEDPAVGVAGQSSSNEADVALVAAVATGDRDALAALYDGHSQAVLAVARRMLGPGAAEDLLHDVFLEVWHHAAEYAPARGSVRAWLMVRTRSRALDRLGRRNRDARAVEQVSLATSAGASAPLVWPDGRDVDARRVGNLALRLAPELVSVLELAYFEGLSCSEIGDRLALPVGTVKSRLARALSQLRQAVGFAESGAQS